MEEALFVERKVLGEKGKDQRGKQRVDSALGEGSALPRRQGPLLYFLCCTFGIIYALI